MVQFMFLNLIIFFAGFAGCVDRRPGSTSMSATGRVKPTTDGSQGALGAANAGAASGNTQLGFTPAASAGTTTCGYQNLGKIVHVATNLDICSPPTVCSIDVCPPSLGTCTGGQCIYRQGYKGVQTLPEAWATYYCQLSTGGCNGVGQVEKPAATAQKLGAQLGLPVCEGAAAGQDCIGVAAANPVLIGNSQAAVDVSLQTQAKTWGLGLSEASNVCYKLVGPGGTAYVALTDRCGGYCRCDGSAYQECGLCIAARDLTPNCPCVGAVPGVSDACCGPGCSAVEASCDWCASNNHPHFDLDQDTFNHLCGEKKVMGSCQLSAVAPIACPLEVAWPPP